MIEKEEVSQMTLDEFLSESHKAPDFKHEYDALEGWY